MGTARVLGGVVLGLGVAGGGCGSTPPAQGPSQVVLADTEARATPEERKALGLLALSDPRLRARLGPLVTGDGETALLTALLEEDEGPGLEDGSVDVFAFEARAKLLASAKEALAAPAASLEGDLVRHLVLEEQARLEDERRLGTGAVVLLGATADSFQPPGDDAGRTREDQRLARRLERVRKALGSRSFSLVERDAVDDALDPLERVATTAGLGRTLVEIAHLRIALGELKTAPARAGNPEGFGKRLEVAVGALAPSFGGPELPATLELLRHRAESLLESYEAAAVPKENIAVGDTAAAALRHPEPCPRSAPTGSVRSAGPPPERAEARALLCRFARADTSAAMHVALLAAHDDIVAAQWVAQVHMLGTEPYRAEQGARLKASFTAEEATHRLRRAVVDPVPSVAAALAFATLDTGADAGAKGGAVEGLRERARQWLAFGDAPFDVVRREAFRKPPGGR